MTGATMGGMSIVMGFVLYGAGGLLLTIGQIWLLVRAFQVGLGWGLAVFFLPLANLVFTVKHWAFAKRPFLTGLVGVVLILVGLAVTMIAAARSVAAPIPSARAQRAERRAQARQTTAPKSNREQMADLLADAGIDPANPRTFQGRTLEQMTDALGKPSATMKAGATTTYIFNNCFEVESADGGKTVSGVHYMGE
jgi:hypothetical protein